MICNQTWKSLNIPKNSKILTRTKCHISVKEKVCQWKTEDSANYQENIDGFDTLNMSNVGSYSSMLPYFYSCETSSKRPKKQSQMLEAQIENFQFGIYNVATIIKQGNDISKERLAIIESGFPHCYFVEKIFIESMRINTCTRSPPI